MSALIDPLNNKVPVYALCHIDDQNQDDCAKETLNTTFNAGTTDSNEVSDAHNRTVTLQEDTSPSLNKDMKEIKEIIKRDTPRKRVLMDKNHVNISKTPIKQAKKISPKLRDTLDMAGIKGKENKQVQRPHVGMSAKSVAILNKLKADKLKKEKLDVNGTDGILKVVREKERRGLMTTHPYQKPNVKQR